MICYLCLVIYLIDISLAVNVCEENPCKNGGICQMRDDQSWRECKCQLGYSGPDCETDVCLSQPCLNNGTCIRTINSRNCFCPLGFSGEDCFVDECTANPCRNGATCHPIFEGRQCICPLGYDGQDCETDLCKDLCWYDGQCIRGWHKAECVCQPGRIGERCKEDSCDPNPCYNGRKCVDDPQYKDFQCHCKTEGGDICQYNDIVPYGRPLLPYTYVLPNTTKGFIYMPREPLLLSNSSFYALRVVATGEPTPFQIQIWRENSDKMFTLVYNQRITLAPEATIQEFKFSELGIPCGMARNYYRLALHFPEGPGGVGLYRCTYRCHTYLHQSPPENLILGTQLLFEYSPFKYLLGMKAYFALQGEFGRELDSSSCPKDVDLPDVKFGDKKNILDTPVYKFSVHSQENRDQHNITSIPCVRNVSDHLKLVILGAVLGSLLLGSVGFIIGLLLKIRSHQCVLEPTNAPSTGFAVQPSVGESDAGYSEAYERINRQRPSIARDYLTPVIKTNRCNIM